MKRLFLIAIPLLVGLSFNLFAQENNLDSSRFYNVAIIQVLDKTTAKSSILEIETDKEVEFGSLKIIAHKCWQAPLDQKPESKVLLELFEATYNQEKQEQLHKRIFYGWMFASSPSISGLENPIYDITVLNCKNK